MCIQSSDRKNVKLNSKYTCVHFNNSFTKKTIMSGFNLSAATTAPANTSNTATPQFGFGSSLGTSWPAASSAPAPTNFGASAAPSPFGAAATSTSSLSFGGTSVATQPLTFGVTTTTLASSATKPGFSLGTNTTSNAPLNLSFGSNAAASTSSFSLGTSLNTKTTAAPTTGTQFTLGASTSVATTSAAPVSRGLGGLDTTSNLSQAKNKDVSALEMTVPNEILQLVNHLKDFLKQQKTMSTELARMSSKGSSEVADDITTCQKNLQFIEHNLDKQKRSVEKLRFETNKCLQDFEIAQRNHDHPAMVQNDMESNIKYFSELIKSLQEKGNILKNEIENTQQYLATLPYNNNVTVDELRRIGEMYYKNVIALAGHLHSIHNEVQVLKARHLSFRREILNDHTNIFLTNENPNPSSLFTSHPDTAGPNPFSGLSITASAALNLGTFGLDQSRL
ncbi:nuclear pore complex protein Nup58 [Adelges cooleyi]|uniref:nuclear pore complex protein Nup58 n=1 Tax=Adelges cooleyi TaxID=133065 RepID=UPI002180807C|nr:nuclear pore complex protein Nup58 [Adelges cooleyi]